MSFEIADVLGFGFGFWFFEINVGTNESTIRSPARKIDTPNDLDLDLDFIE